MAGESLKILQERFGFETFRGQQQEIIENALLGGSSLVIMPTGMGKSLCYQLPAVVQAGLTLVISPLIALMKDQVDGALRIGIRAGCINSSLRKEEREKAYRQLAEGKFQLLYVTPERFRKTEFLEALQKNSVSLLAVDEAHCISEWGHDFRPDYTRVGEFRKRLGDPPTMALTATATPQVQQDILNQLHIDETAKRFVEGIERPNLFMAVDDPYGLDDKVRHILGRLHLSQGPAIVYFSLISTLQKAAVELNRLGLSFLTYHGQLADRDRRKNQEEFIHSDSAVILATPAFGLGVNKPNVRCVIHAEVPGSIEAYYQEIGRGGRDGARADCHLLFDADDVSIQMDFIKWANPGPDFILNLYNLLVRNLDRFRAEGLDYVRGELNFYNRRDFRVETALNLLERWEVIEWENKNPRTLQILGEIPAEFLDKTAAENHLRAQNQKLLQMVELARAEGCRRVIVHEYFGLSGQKPCGFCDNCERLGL